MRVLINPEILCSAPFFRSFHGHQVYNIPFCFSYSFYIIGGSSGRKMNVQSRYRVPHPAAGYSCSLSPKFKLIKQSLLLYNIVIERGEQNVKN